jgi:hypothetical protein
MPGQFGTSDNDNGVFANTKSSANVGVFGSNDSTDPPAGGGAGGAGVFGITQSLGGAGVFGTNTTAQGVGVQGNGPDAGVRGFSSSGTGVRGDSSTSNGIFGGTSSSASFGVFGNNGSTDAPTGGGAGGAGVFGLTASPGGAGVFGANNTAQGVGVQGNGPDAGVSGFCPAAGAGVRADSSSGTAVQAFAHAADQSGVFGLNDAPGPVPEGLNRPAGAGVWGHTRVEKGSGVVGSVESNLTQAAGVTGIGQIAGQFFGDVIVTGDVKLTGNDLAESFEVTEPGAVEPGTVMVLDGIDRIRISETPYDKRVAGVVAGAAAYRPGIVLDHRNASRGRQPIALVGKVFCKVDASHGPIELGDLLTTSPTPGHAMKAANTSAAFGAVLGKAMADQADGLGLIPILVALQ